jgi:hypothetical protein
MQTELLHQTGSFSGDLAKVNYSLSFLKGTALNYFKPYLTDNPDNEPNWLSDYYTFVKELMINFGPYDSIADMEIELEQLVMKENCKTTKFFVEFYHISSHLEYNNRALLWKVYCTLLFRSGLRMKWFISTNWHHLKNYGTSFKRSTSITGNASWNSLMRHLPF